VGEHQGQQSLRWLSQRATPGQTPQFARNDNVNLAYEAANTVVNLSQPDQSRMVQKVAVGHNAGCRRLRPAPIR
jgi:hypothetical protein